MKLETRGKYPGVKVHLDPDEVKLILEHAPVLKGDIPPTQEFLRKMAKEIKKLQEKEPTLLDERTPEQIAAILAKEVEAATLKLQRMKDGKDWKKINPDKLQEALNKHVKKD
jgi:hypothetical protein